MSSTQVKQWFQSIIGKLKKYKYTALLLLVGIGLMLLPIEHSEEPEADDPVMYVEEALQEQMEEVLSQVDGVGKVRVLLTLESGAVTSYQEDVEITSNAEETQRQTQTVLISTDNGEAPVTTKTVYPTYKGAVIVCEGADRASVKLNLVQAVSSLTGLSTDHITVIKMKGH